MFNTGLQSNPIPLQRPVGNESAVMYQPSRALQFSLRDSNLTSNLTQTLSALTNKPTVIIESGRVQLPSAAISPVSISTGFVGIEGDGVLLTSGPGEIPIGETGILSWMPVAANLVLAGPAVSGGLLPVLPVFRALVPADMPVAGAGSGTVTSFSAGALSPLFTTSVATAGTTPALTFILSSVAQNSAFLGPVSGGTGVPAFRAITSADLPNSGAGSGTVTSVSFTGGLISIATATSTPALTVAGTSGGIPYFSSASTWASSLLLGAGQVLLGGGAATAPTTSSALSFISSVFAVTGTETISGAITSVGGQASTGALGVPVVVYANVTTALNAPVANSTVFTTTAVGYYRISGSVWPTTLSSSAWVIYPVTAVTPNGAASSTTSAIGSETQLSAPYSFPVSVGSSMFYLASGATIGISTVTLSGSNTGGVYSLAVTIERLA